MNDLEVYEVFSSRLSSTASSGFGPDGGRSPDGAYPLLRLSVLHEVDMFDKNGEFIGQDWGYLLGVLEPGDRRHFSIEVECEREPAEVKAHVAKAEYVPPDDRRH